jgi:hypothetical protein
MPDHPQHFPKWRVQARVAADTERLLGSLPMVLVTPVIAAVFATVVAVHEPSSHVAHAIVIGPSLSSALRYAVEGALGSIFVIVGIVALAMWFRYRIGGDPVWKAVGPIRSEQGPSELWYFNCTAVVAIQPILGSSAPYSSRFAFHPAKCGAPRRLKSWRHLRTRRLLRAPTSPGSLADISSAGTQCRTARG